MWKSFTRVAAFERVPRKPVGGRGHSSARPPLLLLPGGGHYAARSLVAGATDEAVDPIRRRQLEGPPVGAHSLLASASERNTDSPPAGKRPTLCCSALALLELRGIPNQAASGSSRNGSKPDASCLEAAFTRVKSQMGRNYLNK